MSKNKNIPIKYTSRDFNSIKKDLIEHAKRYYPDNYNDFSINSFVSSNEVESFLFLFIVEQNWHLEEHTWCSVRVALIILPNPVSLSLWNIGQWAFNLAPVLVKLFSLLPLTCLTFSGAISSSIKSENLSFSSNFKIKPSVIPFFSIDLTNENAGIYVVKAYIGKQMATVVISHL